MLKDSLCMFSDVNYHGVFLYIYTYYIYIYIYTIYIYIYTYIYINNVFLWIPRRTSPTKWAPHVGREKTHVQALPVEDRTAGGVAGNATVVCDPHHRVFKAPNRSLPRFGFVGK